MKYKVGDKVRVIPRDKAKKTCEPPIYTTVMGDEYGGKVFTVKEVRRNGHIILDTDFGFCWSPKWLEPVGKKNPVVVIYRDGQKVIALDKVTGNKGVAKCSSCDEFEFEVGAKLAFERLYENNEPLNCKFIVTKSENPGFKVGKIYEVVDGRFMVDGEFACTCPLSIKLCSFKELEAYLDSSKPCKCGFPHWDSDRRVEILEVVE